MKSLLVGNVRCIIHVSLTFLLLLWSHQVVPGTAEGEALKDGEKDGNEVPLGKMLQNLKSQGPKVGKAKKKKFLPQPKTVENDVDVLNLVREINLDNLGVSNKFESSNGHKHSPTTKASPNGKHHEDRKRKAGDASSVPVPKRRRSVPAFKSPKKDSRDNSHRTRVSSFKYMEMDEDIPELKGKKSTTKKAVKSSGADLLGFQKNKGKRSDLVYDDEAIENRDEDDVDLKVNFNLL